MATENAQRFVDMIQQLLIEARLLPIIVGLSMEGESTTIADLIAHMGTAAVKAEFGITDTPKAVPKPLDELTTEEEQRLTKLFLEQLPVGEDFINPVWTIYDKQELLQILDQGGAEATKLTEHLLVQFSLFEIALRQDKLHKSFSDELAALALFKGGNSSTAVH
jgi:hypothetical protein